MNVDLTPELESFVRDRVKSGEYNSQSEVVRDALRLLMNREDTRAASIAYLKGALEEGLNDLESGRVCDGPRVFNELKAELRVTAE